jgi:hypothetical protein
MRVTRARASRFVASLVGLVVLAVAGTPERSAAQATVIGQWTTLSGTLTINPIHAALLRTGKVLIVAGSENDQTQTVYRAAVWNPTTGALAPQTVPWDLFCNGMSFLPDGRVLVVGGNLHYYPFYGIRTTTIFDPARERFIQVQDMANGRWYPTNTALGDGGTATFGGYNETGGTNRTVEIYDVPTGWSPEYRAPFQPPLYPWLHLLPNGRLFYSGATTTSHSFDPATATWTLGLADTIYRAERTYGSSVLLPLLPERSYAPRVMIMGGTLNPATATAEIIDLSQATPRWRSLPSMAAARTDMNAVLLPNGKVLAIGGSGRHNVASTASRDAQIFDPVTETWSSAGTQAFARLYHSVALLLPDATVWSAGSNPTEGTYERRMEIYSPPYLFTTNASGAVVPAPRPTITAVPATVGYNAAFRVDTPDATDIASIALIRLGSSTHGFDMEQRMVGLGFTTGPAGSLLVTSPPNVNVAPPGYYMLFLLNRRGVPSVARFVQLAPTPTNQPPRGTITAPAGDVTIAAGQSVTFAGSGADPDGAVASYHWIFPGGSPPGSTAASPGAVSFANPGTYTASLTVVDNLGVNDPSPPFVTVTVQSGQLTAAFTSPAEGATVSGTTTVGMSTSAPAGTSRTFTLIVDGTTVSTQTVTSTTASYAWNTTTVPNGTHTLTLRVTDSASRTATATRTVTVSNSGSSTPFTASFQYPAEGATVGGSQSLGMATTAPWGTPKTFTLSLGTSILMSTSVSTGSTLWWTWDTTTVPNGLQTLTLTVTTSTGGSATATRTVTVSNAGAPPPPPPPPGMTASFTSPPAGAAVSGSTTVGMSVSGASGASNTFQLTIDGAVVSVQTVSGASATYPWDTTLMTNGSHTLEFAVTDATGRSASATRSVTVSNSAAPPLIASIPSPAEGATVTGTTTVSMSASGASGSPTTFSLAVDGTTVSTQSVAGSTASYAWNTAGVANGPHTLTLTVTDSTGRTATATRSVTVANGASASFTAAFTYPASGATVGGTQSVGMSTTAPWGTPKTFTLTVDGATIMSESVATGSTFWTQWNTTTTPNGPRTLRLTVTAGGESATATLPVTVGN